VPFATQCTGAHSFAVSCRVLQSVAECCRVLQSVAECCSVLQSVAECCRMLQSVAECCRVLQSVALSHIQCLVPCALYAHHLSTSVPAHIQCYRATLPCNSTACKNAPQNSKLLWGSSRGILMGSAPQALVPQQAATSRNKPCESNQACAHSVQLLWSGFN